MNAMVSETNKRAKAKAMAEMIAQVRSIPAERGGEEQHDSEGRTFFA